MNLNRAFLCVECDEIYEGPGICPKCLNSQLAAAPVLLKVLKKAVDRLELLSGVDTTGVIKEAKAAIAQAEGDV